MRFQRNRDEYHPIKLNGNQVYSTNVRFDSAAVVTFHRLSSHSKTLEIVDLVASFPTVPTIPHTL